MSLFAQSKEARDRLTVAHAQYYTPTTSGLKSFHCDVAIDWKATLTRLSGTEIADNNPGLVFLKTVQLSTNDNLRGNGELVWTNPVEPPAERKAAMQQIQDGLQATFTGFFQSWNAFMNGSMVPFPDNSVTVTNSGDGVHLNGKTGAAAIDEDYDKNMLLTKVVVTSPANTVLMTPTYISSENGLLISSVESQIHQPPTAPATDVSFRVEYAKVDSYQIPSRVVVVVKNAGLFDFAFNACKVSQADWASKN